MMRGTFRAAPRAVLPAFLSFVIAGVQPALCQDSPLSENPQAELRTLLRQRMEPVQPAPQPIMPGNLPAENLVRIMELRLRQWSEHQINFLAQAGSLDDSQVGDLRGAAKDFLDQEMRRYRQTPYTQEIIRGNRPCDDFPVEFTLDNAIAGRLRSLLEIFVRHWGLSPDQKTSIQAALDERTRFEQQALRDYIVALLDAELFLSPEQRKRVVEGIPLKNCSLEAWLYNNDSSVVKHNGVPVRSLQLLDLASALTPAQAVILAIMNKGGSSGSFTLNSPVTHDEWIAQLDAAALKQRDHALSLGEIRLSYYKDELGFPEDAVNRLRVAAKGAAVDLSEEWKVQMRQNIEPSEAALAQQQGSSTTWGITGMTGQRLEAHALWSAALTSELQALRDNRLQQRITEQKRVMARLTICMLDRELCFTPRQQEALVPKFAGVFPKQALLVQAIAPEPAWLAYPLIKLKAGDLQDHLQPDQLSLWEDLRSYYAQVQGNRWRIMSSRGRLTTVPYVED